MTPDPGHDVMVYQVTMIDALGGASIGDRWTVWVGQESEGSFDSEGEAIAKAIELADDHRRPAWLVKDGETIAL
jgi:hypothetical protein